MPLPSSVQVGPINYSVICGESEYLRKLTATNDEVCYGWITHSQQQITLDPRCQPDHMRVTMAHEVLHGIFHEQESPPTTEEALTTWLASRLVDTLRRNPDLVAYLTEE